MVLISDVYDVAFLQDIGGRNEQQDRVAVLWGDAACLVVLADGLGGHIEGAFAAQTAVDIARRVFTAAPTAAPADLFQAIVRHAHRRINAAAGEGPYYPRNYPGTTCVLLHLTPTQASWTHLGDSRLYHHQGGSTVKRTTDYCYVEGGLSACLGADLPLPPLAIETAAMPASDLFLLCSDGLWGNMPDDEHYMADVLQRRGLRNGLHALVVEARSRGGELCDNISVAAVRCRRVP